LLTAGNQQALIRWRRRLLSAATQPLECFESSRQAAK
jgi:hypothetical protein